MTIKSIALYMFGMIFPLSASAESLYVFIPTEVRANVMQDKIGAFCLDVDVTVFGRAKDFHKQMKISPPNAILSLMPVINYNETYSATLNGSKNGSISEDYVLVSIDKALDLAAITGKRIGAIDLLGRKPMSDFISKLFNTKVKLKRVTKVEDLLALITFGSVDGIFIAESLFEQLRLKSNLNLISTRLNIKLGLASAAISGSTDRKMTECIAAFDTELNTTLGVDKWYML